MCHFNYSSNIRHNNKPSVLINQPMPLLYWKIQGVFFLNCFSRFSIPKWKTSCSQPEIHFQEIFNRKKIMLEEQDFFFILWLILHPFKINPQNDEVRRKRETAAFLGEIWMSGGPVHFEERRTSHEQLEEEKGICRERFTRRKEEKGAGRDLLGRKVWQMRVE